MKQKVTTLMFNNGKMKKMRIIFYLDICLLKWFTQCQNKSIPVSGIILLEKAKQYWKKRHKEFFQTACKESASVDTNKIKNVGTWTDNKILSETIKNTNIIKRIQITKRGGSRCWFSLTS